MNAADRPVPGTRRVAWLVALAGSVVFVGLSVMFVPWDPVPGGPVRPVPVDVVFTDAQLDRAEAYSSGARTWSRSSLALSLLVLAALGLTGAGARLVRRLPGPWWAQVALAVAAISVAVRLVTLPFAVLLHDLRLEHGLSTQPWTGFALDLLKAEVVDVVVTALALVLLVGLARRWRRAWPAVAGVVLAVLVFLGSFVYPLLVEPLFNAFEPLPAGHLRTEVMRLAEVEGVPVDEVLVADASRRTTTLNAWVSGFGSTRRVVLYDNLVEDLPADQALSVVAHELAHARHDDVLVGTALGAAGVLAATGLLGVLLGARLSRPGGAGAAAVPAVLALLAIGGQLASPVENGISRRVELRADVEALRATGDAEAFVSLQRSLAVRSLADPTPADWSHWWWGSHPGVLERIAVARRVASAAGESGSAVDVRCSRRARSC